MQFHLQTQVLYDGLRDFLENTDEKHHKDQGTQQTGQEKSLGSLKKIKAKIASETVFTK